eukprot:TRINITY_DN27936_c0_g1_i1.p1 TRINITY_DN27936_c0_g1~~TRINITY_DN27936_c0_g1_i1.p1  ORF type:complete len:378 (-),score=57.97 TRINITY_DN27936_c0_g1_i1:86-1219(-)
MENLTKIRDYLFNWFDNSHHHNTRKHILRGFVKSFLLYAVPMTALKRKDFVSHLRRAFALGIFVAGVRAGDDILTKLKSDSFQGNPSTSVEEFVSKYTLGVSAFIAALVAILVDGDIQESITVVLWTTVRALRGWAPEVPGGAILLMCLTSAQLLSTWLVHPEEHNYAYKKFLDYQGGKAMEELAALRDMPLNPCEVLHPNSSCASHFAGFWKNSLPRSFRLYGPVYLVSFLLSSSKNIPRTLFGFVRSMVFLSSYCSLAWLSMCYWHRLRKYIPWQFERSPVTRGQLFLHTSVTGLALLVESKSRRPELAAYCLTYALETLLLNLKKKGIYKPSPSLNALILAISAGVLVHHHEHQPKAVVHWLFKLGSGTVRVFP